MRSLLASLVLTVAIAEALAAPAPPGAAAPTAAALGGTAAAGTWLVRFEEAPLAAFRGSPKAVDAQGKALAPTSPEATGARKLDVGGAAAKAYLGWLDARHRAFLDAAAAALGRPLTPRFRYRVAANGMALTLTAAEAAALAELPGVAAVSPEFTRRPMTDAGPQFIGADALWNGTVQGSNVRTRGEGVVIGVIDSGVNAAHPAFADVGADGHDHSNPRGRYYGLCLTAPARCNDKLIGIYDFTQEGARDGSDATGHGTHVASTAAGNVVDGSIVGQTVTVPLRVSGVAPHANLITYKACIAGEDGACLGSALIAALDQAIADGVDVINYSIGGDPRDPWSGLRGTGSDDAEAFLNARTAGIVGVVAAGNEGPGESTVTSPGNAPWVITAANASHNRRFAIAATDVTGTGIGAPRRYEGLGLAGPLGKRRIVSAATLGFPLCSKGQDIDFPPTGASNPFAPGTFNGEIVLCERGITSRVSKGFNVRAAGAGGMILYNGPADAESLVSDDHYLPAVHIGNRAGAELVQLLAAANAAGGSIDGAISGTEVRLDGPGGVLSASSGRGPVTPFEDWLVPDLTAPGSNILAAAQTGSGLASNSGTSMATPHIAGAAALLIAANPSWTPSQIESALLTTASADVRLEDGSTPAGAHAMGAGRVVLPAAVRAGLYFETTREQFVLADPSNSMDGPPPAGNPRELNLPALVQDDCFARCVFRRRVTALVDGAWRVVGPQDAAVTVTATPETFTLAAGQSQDLEFSVDVSAPEAVGRWTETRVGIVNAGITPVASDIALPVAVYSNPGAIPDQLAITAESSAGVRDLSLSGLAALRNPVFEAAGLAPLRTRTERLVTDPTPNDPFDLPSAGVFVQEVTVADPEFAPFPHVVYADTSSVTATDVDLYVGPDNDSDGLLSEDEVACKSISPGPDERCIVTWEAGEVPTRILILVQSFAASGVSGDTVGLRWASFGRGQNSTEGGFAATAPGRVASSAAFDLRVAWNEPRMQPNETWVGLIGFRSGATGPVFRRVPLYLTLAGNANPIAPLVADATGDFLSLVLAPGAAHDRLVIDVPPNANSLIVRAQSLSAAAGQTAPNIDLYLIPAGATPDVHTIAPAPPRAQAVRVGNGPENDERLVVGGTELTPGRWYAVPHNPGTTPVALSLIVGTESSANAVPDVPDNGYFNPARPGHGIFFHRLGENWGVIWYTYREDGSPIWYLGVAKRPESGEAVWTVPLQRFTWDGAASAGTPVGHATITLTGPNALRYSWLVDGQYGSEPMQTTGAIGCPAVAGAPLSIAGSWFAPALPGYGFNIVAQDGLEAATAYLYDEAGNPRWALGSTTTPGTGSLVLSQYRGFCPQCAAVPVQAAPVGSLTRSYAGASGGQAATLASFVAPVVGTWTSDHAWQKLTADLACP